GALRDAGRPGDEPYEQIEGSEHERVQRTVRRPQPTLAVALSVEREADGGGRNGERTGLHQVARLKEGAGFVNHVQAAGGRQHVQRLQKEKQSAGAGPPAKCAAKRTTPTPFDAK